MDLFDLNLQTYKLCYDLREVNVFETVISLEISELIFDGRIINVDKNYVLSVNELLCFGGTLIYLEIHVRWIATYSLYICEENSLGFVQTLQE